MCKKKRKGKIEQCGYIYTPCPKTGEPGELMEKFRDRVFAPPRLENQDLPKN
jgi:hypothetical protein